MARRSRQREKLAELRMLTVIVPQRTGAEMDWEAERLESDTVVGVRVSRGGKATLVAFRKADQGQDSLGRVTFDGVLKVEGSRE